MISEFITEVRTRGLARTNRFMVEIPFPSGGGFTVNPDGAKLTQLFCESVSIPGLNVSTQPHRTYGEAREMPYERTFEPIQMTFYVDAGMQVKTAFDQWLSMIVNPQTRAIGYYDQYAKDILIHVMTIEDEPSMSIKLMEAYPKTVGAIQMSQESKDIMKINVTWQYKNWLSYNYGVGGKQFPPPVIRPGSDPTAESASELDNSPQGFEGDDPPVTEEEIIDVEDSQNYGDWA